MSFELAIKKSIDSSFCCQQTSSHFLRSQWYFLWGNWTGQLQFMTKSNGEYSNFSKIRHFKIVLFHTCWIVDWCNLQILRDTWYSNGGTIFEMKTYSSQCLSELRNQKIEWVFEWSKSREIGRRKFWTATSQWRQLNVFTTSFMMTSLRSVNTNRHNMLDISICPRKQLAQTHLGVPKFLIPSGEKGKLSEMLHVLVEECKGIPNQSRTWKFHHPKTIFIHNHFHPVCLGRRGGPCGVVRVGWVPEGWERGPEFHVFFSFSRHNYLSGSFRGILVVFEMLGPWNLHVWCVCVGVCVCVCVWKWFWDESGQM